MLKPDFGGLIVLLVLAFPVLEQKYTTQDTEPVKSLILKNFPFYFFLIVVENNWFEKDYK